MKYRSRLNESRVYWW